MTLAIQAQSRLTFEANQGSGVMSDTLLMPNDSIALPPSQFERFGYQFNGWNTQSDGSGIYYNDQDSFAIGTTDMSLYAQWQKYDGGEGSILSPWQIGSTEALILLSQSPEDWNDYFIQTATIHFPEDESLVDWNADGLIGNTGDTKGFFPIGNTVTSFSGQYDAQGFRIDSLYIDNDIDYSGLFGIIDGGQVKNLTLRAAAINGLNYIGGMVGRAINGSILSELYVHGTINGQAFVGGLIGSIEDSFLKNAASYSDITAKGTMSGGLVGRISGGEIINSFASGSVISEQQNVGGFAGFVQDNAVISNSYSSAGVSGLKYVGAFAGILSASTINNCYASGATQAESYSGGFMSMNGSSTLNNCYYDQQTTWHSGTSPGLEALATDDFNNYGVYFTQWDFGSDEAMPWQASPLGRPYLYWQKVHIYNSKASNSPLGYQLSQAHVEDEDDQIITKGLRYKKMGDSDWIILCDSTGEGDILKTISGISQDDYWVQAIAQDSLYTYYGDMSKLALHTLHFDNNGGSGTMADTLLAAGDSISLPLSEFYHLGYHFSAWNTTADQSGQSFNELDSFAIGESDSTLYALWTARDFTITYHLDGGINHPDNPSSYTVDSLIYFKDPSKKGYDFVDWYAEDSFLTKINSLPLNCKQDTALYAKWQINTYYIVYHGNKGSALPILEADTFNHTITLRSNDFKKSNHTFKYWTTEADGSGQIFFDGDNYTVGDSTLRLYAQWQKYCGGDGTEESPWEICSPEALILLSQSPEDWDNYFIQTADIFFDEDFVTYDWNMDGSNNDEAGFSPIGNSSTKFSGTYLGQNHSIYNLYIYRPSEDNVGLFGYSTSDTICGIGLSNVNISGQNNVGALVGYASYYNTVYNCYSNGIVSGEEYTGGLIGQSHGSNLKNAYSSCAVMSSSLSGGLMGRSHLSNIENCYSTGVVTGENCGGFVGSSTTSSYSSCYYDGETSMQAQACHSGILFGIETLTTEDFANHNNFEGWNIGIGIEDLPWLPNLNGRPHLYTQYGTVSNGLMFNDYMGYNILHAYADSVKQAPGQSGVRYRSLKDSVWTYHSESSGIGSINCGISGLDKGAYFAQAYADYGDRIVYGDMTLMRLATLHFEANGGSGFMKDTLLVVGDSIYFPDCTFAKEDAILAEWNTQSDGMGIAFSPKGQFAIGENDSTLYAQWRLPFAQDDYRDGIVAGSTMELDLTINDTIGGVPYGSTFPIEIIENSTVGSVSIEGNQIVYSPPLTFSGPDFFSYLVDYNGAVDTAEVVVLVFDAPGNMVNTDCYVKMPQYEWLVNSAGEDPEGDINVFNTPLVGDLYGDSYPEVAAILDVGNTWTSTEIAVYNGSENALNAGRNIIEAPKFNASATPMAIAKIYTSSDTLRPTLFVADIDRRISAYNPKTGDEVWHSSAGKEYCKDLGNNEGAFLGVADFNNDKKQEVYAANRIYDAETGALLCSGPNNTDIGHFFYGSTSTEDYSSPYHHMMHTASGDFDRDGDLELAAGRYVFDVDIDNGLMPVMAYLPSSASTNTDMIADGITVVADIDMDGDLDVIVAHLKSREDVYCYVWDGQTPTLIAEKYIHNSNADSTRYGVGVPFIGDLNGDGRPEIAFTISNRQYAFYYDNSSTELQEYYTLEHTDRSGFTGLTLFDFNNDDIAEIVYRDETDLRIINASGISHLTGNDTLNADGTPVLYNLATYPCESETQGEYAVVVDIDLDDQAEILVTNQANGSHLNIFESGAGSKWVAARPVWNQYGYNVTNVNNDVTIPRYAINNSMIIEVDSLTSVQPFNHFLQQMGNVTILGENVILTPDLYMGDSYYTNDGTTGTITIDIINQGDADFYQEDSSICFYGGDPYDGGVLLAVRDISADIAWEDTLKDQTYTFSADPSLYPRIYVRLNDDGQSTFPDILNIQQECNYDNNTMLAAIFEVISHFTWNGYDLSGVSMNTGDSSATDGIVHMLIDRGDTIDIIPELEGYIFVPDKTLPTTLDGYLVYNDTLQLQNVQANGVVTFTAYKIPEISITPKVVAYDKEKHSGDYSVSSGTSSIAYYRNSNDSVWTTERPDSVGYYDLKIVCEANYLYTSAVDSLDSALQITPRPVTFLLEVEDKNYDGSDTVVSFSTTHDALAGDSLYLQLSTGDLHFADPNVGYHQVYPSANWILTGEDADNYTLEAYDTVYANIYKQPLIISANDSTKFYDGESFYGGNGITAEGFALGEDTADLEGQLIYVPTASSQGAINKGVYDISVSGFSSDNYDISYVDGTLTIDKIFLLIEFNGNTIFTYGDSINLTDYTSPDVVNLAPGDTFIHNSLGFASDTSNAGELETGVHHLDIGDSYILNEHGDTVTDNYDISFSPENITVLPKELYVINAEAESKIYDATLDAEINGATLYGVIDGDSVTLINSFIGQFIQTDVGTDIEVFYDNSIEIIGEDAHNYILMPFNTSLFADIYPKELHITDTKAEDKYYDGDSAAVVHGTILHGVIAGDDVYLINDTCGFFEQKDAGNDLKVTTDIDIAGTKSHNYYLTQDLDLEANIFPRPLVIKANDSTKVYDAMPFYGGHGIVCTGFIAGEDTSYLTGDFIYTGDAQAAIDTGHYLITPSGFSANNYSITYVSDTLTILPRVLNFTYRGEDTITYGQDISWEDYAPIVTGVASSDTLTIAYIGFETDLSSSGHPNVGDRMLMDDDVWILNKDKDTVNYNYIYSFTPSQLTVLPKDLHVINAVAKDKVYDNSYEAVIDSAILDSVVWGDEVILHQATSGLFVDKNVAENIEVIPDSMWISGADIANYTLYPIPTLEADIYKADLYFTVKDTTRMYGTNNPPFYYDIEGFVTPEDLTVLDQLPSIYCGLDSKTFVGQYTDAIKLTGGSDNNYNYIFEHGDLTITQVPIHVRYTAEDTLVYGSIPSTVDYIIESGQMMNNDTLLLNNLSFGNDLSSSGHLVVGEHPILAGEIKAMDETMLIDVTVNYDIIFTPSHIYFTPKPISVLWEASDKEYDGNPSGQIHFLGFDDICAGDSIDIDKVASAMLPDVGEDYLEAFFTDKNVANNKLVTPVNVAFTGVDLKNYSLTIPELHANITPRNITWFGLANDKAYDGTTLAQLDTIGLERIIAGDDIAISYDEANFSQADAGTNLNVTLTNLTLYGADKDNYNLDYGYPLTADIYKADLIIQVNDISFIYGNSVPEISFNYEGFIDGEDESVLEKWPQMNSAIESKFDVGYYSLWCSGAQAKNYNISYQEGQAYIMPRPTNILYSGPEQICENDYINIDDFKADNLVTNDRLDYLQLIVTTLEDDSLASGLKYHVERGETIIKNENDRDVTDNYIITMLPIDIELLEMPRPELGDNLEFCGICEYDFDAGEGISYLWSTGDTTRYITVQGTYRGSIWVRVQNSNNCWNTDTVSISVESKYLKTYIIAYIYPNPNNGRFRVELSDQVTDYAYIYSLSGNFMKKVWVDGYGFDVDVNFPDGAYIIEILDAKEIFLIEHSTLKLVKD